jgi:hypothetical protein
VVRAGVLLFVLLVLCSWDWRGAGGPALHTHFVTLVGRRCREGSAQSPERSTERNKAKFEKGEVWPKESPNTCIMTTIALRR